MSEQIESTGLDEPTQRVVAAGIAPDPDYLRRLIPEQAAAEFLGVEVKTLQAWRVRGGGPAFVRLSRRAIRYQRQCLLNWVEARVHTSTSEYVP